MTPAPNASFWLRVTLHAYPRRWRETRQAELLGVLTDSVPDRPHWPGLPALVDLVLSGWRTRWQLRPPTWRWAGYRFLDLRLPPAWREWVRSDITGRWWLVRRLSLVLPAVLVLTANSALFISHSIRGWPDAGLTLASVVGAISLLTWPLRKRLRAKALCRHAPDHVPVAWIPTQVWLPAPSRLRAAPSLLCAGVLLTVGAPVAAWTLIGPSNGPVSQALSVGSEGEQLGHIVAVTRAVVCAGALAAPLLIALGHRRVARRLATATTGMPGAMPPHRIRPSTLVAVAGAQVLVEALICVGQLADAIPAIFALALAGGGLCVGPLLIALARTARTTERTRGVDITLHDCRRAVFGRSSVIAPEVGRWIVTPQPARIEGPQFP